jgi:Fe-S-cluster containining protein
MTSFDCTACGACCASFRVDFHPSDGEGQGGSVPAGLYDELNRSMARMRGTDHAPPRCCALRGSIGEAVICVIYDERPGPCREFEAGSPACLRARSRHGIGGSATND